MISKVKETVEKYSLLKKADKVLLAVSGGPDSMAMSYIFKELQPDLNLKIGIAYFHHSIREDADKELKFVSKVAKDFEFPFYWQKKDIPELAKQGKRSLEEVARLERYRFLIETAKNRNYSKVAVAHHKDDQVETFLHRLLRGAGLKGLKSISPMIEREGIKIIRPLIECSREEIESFLNNYHISTCLDSSNYETKFIRNKIRHCLIPYLMKDFNPNVKEVLYNTVENIRFAYDFIENEVKKRFKRCVKKSPSYVKIKVDKFKKLHAYLKREIIRKAIEDMKGDLRRFGYAHWKEIESLLNDRPLGSVVDLPNDISITKNKLWILVGRHKKDG